MRNRTQQLCLFAIITSVLLFITVTKAHATNDKEKGDGWWKKNSPSCSDLPSLRLPNAVIISATEMNGNASLPSHCLAYGVIEEQINFEVKLPSEWNRKLFMGGNGGFAGGFRNWGIDSALKRGYATTQTDTGHQANRLDASWALDNREAEINFGHRAVHLTVNTVKNILRKYYGDDVRYSYFQGCSRGGGEAMMESQRYPQDFDGIIAGAPAYDWTGSMGMGFVWNQQAIYPDSTNLLSPRIPNSKLALIRNAVLQSCDAIDGLTDNLIDDPRNCPFDPAVDLPLCPDDADGPSCFTLGQVAALESIYSGPSNPQGQLYPGFLPCGAEDYPDAIGWYFWFTDGRAILQAGFGIDGPNGQYVFGEQFLKYLVYDDPAYALHSFDFETDVRDLAHTAKILNATKTNLREFKTLGHKMIMYQGWADPAITALGTIDYYEKVLERMDGREKVENFFRLFMVPGMLHCSGGPGPNVADWLTALENWVERGLEPDRIMGSDQSGDWTRPLCPYPKVAVHDGSGSIYEASNFTCEEPGEWP